MNNLKHIKCFLLDMDGTVHLSGAALPGAAEAVARMRRQAKVIFVTNNTSVSRNSYVKKLCAIGIESTEKDIYTAGNATADYLLSCHKGKKVYLLGTKDFKREFIDCGIQLTDTAPDLVVIGFDTELTYEKLVTTCNFIRGGVPYLATHPDVNCPAASGYIPDVGSFLSLIERSTEKTPFIICGKPFQPIADGIKKLTGCKPREIAMIGDRLNTDIAFAQNNGFISVLVMTGATKTVAPDCMNKPDIVLQSIALWDSQTTSFSGIKV